MKPADQTIAKSEGSSHNAHGADTAIRRGRRYAFLSVLIAWVIATGLLFVPAWQLVEERVFDFLSIATASGKTQLPITIVGIDEASFAQLGIRWPWPRDMHARLIEKLHQSGAAVIAFDVIFSESATPVEDQAFAAAISKAGNVVLAADHSYHETAFTRQWMRTDPLPEFTKAGAAAGMATTPLSGDAVARKFTQDDDAFWRETIRTFMKVRPGTVEMPSIPPDARIRYLGPAHTFPYVSYYQVLHGDPNISPDFFADQIVLIGRDVRASPELGAQSDTFATPFLLSSKLLTPGVEIHATMIENAMMGQAIEPASNRQNLALLSLIMAITWLSLLAWHPVRSAALILILVAGCIGMSIWLFKAQNLWVATATPALSPIWAMIIMATLSYYTERKRAKEIRGAFSLYVASEVVDEIVAHPERLKLGGERRELSIMFCDLAGFTTISEQLPTREVAHIINLYLDEMTNIIMVNKGTVVSFMGDGIMAFWGAPLDDEQHAIHATHAAIAMQEAMPKLQLDFVKHGTTAPVGLRIGVHTGHAIVGNMGSSLRFSYTALGDTVNLSARLEGVNKAYGTGILVSADTAAGIGASIALRRVDHVRVKGKESPIGIFTPCSDPDLIETTDAAWQAYINQEWDRAEEIWSQIATRLPYDTLAKVFFERILAYRINPPPTDWDGSVPLEKM